jgi:hypothetical protein
VHDWLIWSIILCLSGSYLRLLSCGCRGICKQWHGYANVQWYVCYTTYYTFGKLHQARRRCSATAQHLSIQQYPYCTSLKGPHFHRPEVAACKRAAVIDLKMRTLMMRMRMRLHDFGTLRAAADTSSTTPQTSVA